MLYTYFFFVFTEDVELIGLFLCTLTWTLRTYEWIYMRSPEAQEPPFTVFSFFFSPPLWIYCILDLHNPVRSPIHFNSVYGSSRQRSPCKPPLTFKVYFKANSVSGRQTLFSHIQPQSPWWRRGEKTAIGCVLVVWVGRQQFSSWRVQVGWSRALVRLQSTQGVKVFHQWKAKGEVEGGKCLRGLKPRSKTSESWEK